MRKRSFAGPAAALFWLVLASLGGCGASATSPPESSMQRDGAGRPVDARYGTPLPGSQPGL
jgi:hypothetical protein